MIGPTVAVLLAWLGATIVLSTLPATWRRPLRERLRPYLPPGNTHRRGVTHQAESLRALAATIVQHSSERLTSALGMQGSLQDRLVRLHDDRSPIEVRVRHATIAAAAMVGIGVVLGMSDLPPLAAAVMTPLSGLLLVLILEQQIVSRDEGRRAELLLELPVIAEQLGMLIEAGYSLIGSLDRVSRRGVGVGAQDLRRVCTRIQHGLAETEALAEWSEISQVPAVARLTAVLALSGEASDLGRLIGEEARSVRREVHRTLAGELDRRAQQVWIPVTVATLVPGTVLLAIPFLAAMHLYAAA